VDRTVNSVEQSVILTSEWPTSGHLQQGDHRLKLEFQEDAAAYEGPTQKARIWTEGWVAQNLFCPNCGAASLGKLKNNVPAADFRCEGCAEQFELKSKNGGFGTRVVDGAFKTMRERVLANDNPNLLLLSYDLSTKDVRGLQIVPRHFFTLETLESRKPLSASARRAGWIGCNILLGKIPEAGRIHVIRDRAAVPKAHVLDLWRKTLFLREQAPAARGWLIDVMMCVEQLGRPNFSLDEVYEFVPHLQSIYPENRHVREKVRQQLQVLRDNGYLEFEARGRYRLTRSA